MKLFSFRQFILARILSLLTSLTIIFLPPVYAAPSDTGLGDGDIPKILKNLPAGMGTLQSVSSLGSEAEKSGEPWVIHIQDAHANPSAQQSIESILNYLVKQFPEMKVAVEGAQGGVHPEYFDMFPEYPEAGEAVVRDLLEKGELSGAELFAWKQYKNRKESLALSQKGNPQNALLISGVEIPDLYRDNAEGYREFLSGQDKTQENLKRLYEKKISEASAAINPDLKKFIEERRRRKEGKYSAGPDSSLGNMMVYLDFLASQAEQILQVDLADPVEQLRFPNIVRILKLKELEKKWDPVEAENEWQRILERLDVKDRTEEESAVFDEIKGPAQQHVLGRSGNDHDAVNHPAHPRRLFESLDRFARRIGLNLYSHPHFMDSWTLWIFQSELESRRLWDEMTVLENWVLQNLAATPEEKAWIETLDQMTLLEKLCRLELSREEERKVLENLPSVQSLVPEDLQTAFQNGLKFYETARKRDQVLLNNALALIDTKDGAASKSKVVVLITGGFHTEGIQALLEEKGIPSAVISPSVRDLDDGERYRKVMAESNADLSGYYQVANPFLTKQQALFFREMLEVAVPVLIGKYQVPPSEIAAKVKKGIEKSPVLSQAVAAELETTGGGFVKLSAKAVMNPVTLNRSTVSGLLNSASTEFAEAAGFRRENTGAHYAVEYAMTASGPHIQIKTAENSQVQLGAVKITTGRIPKGWMEKNGLTGGIVPLVLRSKTGRKNPSPFVQRSEMRATTPALTYKTDVTDSGSIPTQNEDYFLRYTRPRIMGDLDAERYTRLEYQFGESSEQNSFSSQQMRNASPIDIAFRERLRHLEGNDRLRTFLQANSAELNRDGNPSLNIYLLEPEAESRESHHPLFLTALGLDFSVAFSGTRSGKQHAVYMTRQAFLQLPMVLLVDILINQVSMAIQKKNAWKQDSGMPFPTTFTPAMQAFAGRLRRNTDIKEARTAIHAYDTQIRDEHFVTDVQSRSVITSLIQIKTIMPDYAVADALLRYSEAFHAAIKHFDFKKAIYFWGLLTYELQNLEASAREYRGTLIGDKAEKLLGLQPMKPLLGLVDGITQALRKYIEDYGISNEGGEAKGLVVGKVHVVPDPEKISGEFEKEAVARRAGSREDVIWVVPYLPVHYNEIPGEALVISVGGNRHAIDTTNEQGIPLAVVPNAVELLRDFDGQSALLRIDEDGEIRFRRAHAGETSIKQVKEKITLRIPPARTDGPLTYKLSDVDENFVSFVGPKAATLGRLMSAGIPVPEGIVLSFAFWKSFLDQNPWLQGEIDHQWQEIKIEGGRIVSSDDEVRQTLETLKEIIRRAPFPDNLKAEVKRAAEELHGREISDPELNTLLDHIRGVFAAKYNLAPVQARVRHKIAEKDVMPAVILQVPKSAKYAGTLYTADTISHDRNSVTMIGSYGQGASVVGERGHPAEVRVDKFTKEIEHKQTESLMDRMYRIANFSFLYSRSSFNLEDLTALRTAGFYDSFPDRSDASSPDSSLQLVEVPREEKVPEIFTPELASQLLEYAERIEKLFDIRPQDIEWLVDPDGKIWVVQSRPQKTETLPTELMLDDEVMERTAGLDYQILSRMKEAANKGDVETLFSMLLFNEPLNEVMKDKVKSIQRVIAARYLLGIFEHPELAKSVDASKLQTVIEAITSYYQEDLARLMDPFGSVNSLLNLLRMSLPFVPEQTQNDIRALFVAISSMNTAFYTHLFKFAVARGLVAFKEYASAVVRLTEARQTALVDPGVADRSVRILEEIPIEYSGDLLRKYATYEKHPVWLQEYAARVIERLSKARSEMRVTAVSEIPAGSTEIFREKLERNLLGSDFENPAIDPFAPSINAVASGLGGIYFYPAVREYFPAAAGSGFSDSEALARQWIERQVAGNAVREVSEVKNPGLEALVREILSSEQKGKSTGMEIRELGAEVHVQLPKVPQKLNSWVPVLATLASLQGKLRLNISGLSKTSAENFKSQILTLAKNQGVSLKQDQFEVFGSDFFDSVPKARLENRYGLLGENVGNYPRRKGISLFQLDPEAVDQPEILSTYILTVMRAMALGKAVEDYASVLDPRKLEPGAFEAILKTMGTYLQIQEKILASA